MERNLTLTEKYRPKNLNEIRGNSEVIKAIHAIITTSTLPNLLFSGPPGIGKTTTIRIIAKNLFHPRNVLELNASDERGIQVVREQIKQFSSTKSDQLKLIIMDEADSMSRDAQNALRRIIEDFSNNARFCLIANYFNRIIPALQSRMVRFRFGPVDNVKDRLKEIVDSEQIIMDDDALTAISILSDGDLRKAITDLDGLNRGFKKITKQDVYSFTGTVQDEEFIMIFEKMLILDFDGIVRQLEVFVKKNLVDCSTIAKKLINLVKRSEIENKRNLIIELCNVDYNTNQGCNLDVQCRFIAGAFIKFRN